jgi:two-component system, NarL family, invasion response regulator UvrY
VRRVLLVDDHPIIRQGFRRILTQAFSDLCVGEAETGEQAIALSESSVWDLIILDLSLPGLSGLEVIRDVRRMQPESRIIVVSIHSPQQFARRALSVGAAAYLEKSAAPEEMVKAVAEVLEGRSYVSPSGLEVASGVDSTTPPHELLSDREYQVLRMLGVGKTVSEIAAELSLSVKTVSTYRTRILGKTGLRTTAELMRYVISHNLIP